MGSKGGRAVRVPVYHLCGPGFRELDPCEDEPCINGGTCMPYGEQFECLCRPGFHGERCQHVTARGLENSIILKNYGNISYLQTLATYLAPVLQSKGQWKRCWHAMEDGWDVDKTFHPQCDKKGPTVTIVRVGQTIFGGYADQPWTSDNSYHFSNATFIYSLYNKNGYQPIKLNLTGLRNVFAIYGGSGYGPTFGNGHDLHICNQASTNKNSYTRPHTVYQVPPGCSKDAFCKFFADNVEDYFLVDDIEVFYETV